MPKESSTEDKLSELLSKHPMFVCEKILEFDEGKFFREKLMPEVEKRHAKDILKFSAGVVGALGVSAKDMQDCLKNQYGKQFKSALGLCPFSSRDKTFDDLREQKRELTKKIGLQFSKSNGVVSGFIDVQKYIEYFLSLDGPISATPTPNGILIVYSYTDQAPYVPWSRNFTGLTTIRLKLVEPYNLMSTALTLAAGLHDDSYELVAQMGKQVFHELSSLKEIQHPVTKQSLKVMVRSVANGKEWRLETGLTSATSSYGIPDAPEHSMQYGDLKLLPPEEPQWTVQLAREMAEKYITTWEGRRTHVTTGGSLLKKILEVWGENVLV